MSKICRSSDKVYATWVSSYRDGYKVVEIDKKIGRVWVERDGKTEVKAFG